MSSCSDDDSIIETETENLTGTKNLIELNFIPTIENYFSKDRGTVTYRSSTRSGNWIHKFDDKGRLLKSELLEKYPSRILKEIIFSDYDSEENKVSLNVTTFNYFTLARLDSESYELIFDESYILKSITSKYENEPGEVTVFEKLDDNKRIVLLKNGLIDEYVGYEYDEQGNILKYIVYDTELVVKSTVTYTYTEFGDLESYFFQNTQGEFSEADYFYRSDNTLERLEGSFDYGSENAGNNLFTYANDESYIKRITDYENGESEIYINNGEQIIVEYYQSYEKLAHVYEYSFSESEGKFYLVKYEKYDENGDLDYIEYYDEDGNVTETVNE
jgi:hypothetical protein